jgi:ubiquinone/menaquinone biosynthesis C-methylase UbiE
LISNWREFWDRPHRIYVNDRHRRVHYAQVAADIVGEIQNPESMVLDYGCGEALQAADVAARCKRLYLCESGFSLREALKQRFANAGRIRVIAPEEISELPDGSLDLVVVNSVLQYLTRVETIALAEALRPKLSREGRLIFADVIPPDVGIVSDVSSLLSTAARHGFLLAALSGLAATLVSDYRRLRQQIGLTTYTEAEIVALLEQAGFRAERRSGNFGFNPRRMTIVGRPGR